MLKERCALEGLPEPRWPHDPGVNNPLKRVGSLYLSLSLLLLLSVNIFIESIFVRFVCVRVTLQSYICFTNPFRKKEPFCWSSFFFIFQDLAADCVRIERMLYFGRDILCGLDPPVLKLKFIGPSLSEYVCVVDGSGAAGGGTTGQPRSGPTLDPVSYDYYFSLNYSFLKYNLPFRRLKTVDDLRPVL